MFSFLRLGPNIHFPFFVNSLRWAGLTITNILDLSICRLRFKQLQQCIDLNKGSYHPSLPPIRSGEISPVRSFAMAIVDAKFRHDNGESSFGSTKIRERFVNESSRRNSLSLLLRTACTSQPSYKSSFPIYFVGSYKTPTIGQKLLYFL